MQCTVNCGKVGHAAFPFGSAPVVATETRRFDTSSTWQEPSGASLSGRHQAPGSLRMPRGASGILEGNRSLLRAGRSRYSTSCYKYSIRIPRCQSARSYLRKELAFLLSKTRGKMKDLAEWSPAPAGRHAAEGVKRQCVCCFRRMGRSMRELPLPRWRHVRAQRPAYCRVIYQA
jgi:hypothetical protein